MTSPTCQRMTRKKQTKENQKYYKTTGKRAKQNTRRREINKKKMIKIMRRREIMTNIITRKIKNINIEIKNQMYSILGTMLTAYDKYKEIKGTYTPTEPIIVQEETTQENSIFGKWYSEWTTTPTEPIIVQEPISSSIDIPTVIQTSENLASIATSVSIIIGSVVMLGITYKMYTSIGSITSTTTDVIKWPFKKIKRWWNPNGHFTEDTQQLMNEHNEIINTIETQHEETRDIINTGNENIQILLNQIEQLQQTIERLSETVDTNATDHNKNIRILEDHIITINENITQLNSNDVLCMAGIEKLSNKQNQFAKFFTEYSENINTQHSEEINSIKQSIINIVDSNNNIITQIETNTDNIGIIYETVIEQNKNTEQIIDNMKLINEEFNAFHKSTEESFNSVYENQSRLEELIQQAEHSISQQSENIFYRLNEAQKLASDDIINSASEIYTEAVVHSPQIIENALIATKFSIPFLSGVSMGENIDTHHFNIPTTTYDANNYLDNIEITNNMNKNINIELAKSTLSAIKPIIRKTI